MMTCEECLHQGICDESSRTLWNTLHGEAECSDFKDKTEYVKQKHGHWIRKDGKRFCSVCKRQGEVKHYYENGEVEEYPHCPNCGAKMDGD